MFPTSSMMVILSLVVGFRMMPRIRAFAGLSMPSRITAFYNTNYGLSTRQCHCASSSSRSRSSITSATAVRATTKTTPSSTKFIPPHDAVDADADAADDDDNVNFNDDDSCGSHRPPQRSKKFHPYPFDYHEEIVLRIDDLTNLGVGVGRILVNGSQWVVMVPLCLPGEEVRARVFRNTPTYSEADLVEVIVTSPERVEAPCPYFMQCGGCNYQHLTIAGQRRWKKKQVETLLERIGGLTGLVVEDVVGTLDFLYEYRTKITPHYNAPKKPQDLKIGFQQRGTRIMIDVEQCMIASPKINEKYAEVRQTIAAQMKQKLPKRGATLLFRECEEGVETNHKNIITQRVGDVLFRFKAGEFFQNNAYVLPLMVEHVVGQAKGNGCTHLLDTYCGSGLFALSAARKFQTVVGIEVSDLAVTAAIANAQFNNAENVKFVCGSSEKIFSAVTHLPKDETVVVIDPPRKGCDMVFLEQLFLFNPKKLVYVSCDPSTQARDAKEIVAAGYTVVNVTPFDLFPQTRHIENVMTFLRE